MSLPPPDGRLRASVVVPARDEEALIGRCIRSLALQTGLGSGEYEVLLVLDGCTDATGDRALEAASEHPDLRLYLLEGPGLGAGHARRRGMEEACERLFSLGRYGALIASTDADTVVSPDWLGRQLSAAADGARAIGGRIELLDEEGASETVRSWRDLRGRARHLELLERGDLGSGSRVEHWQFSGASMSLTAEAYREVGGMEPLSSLEDEQLESSLQRCNIPIQRPLDVRVSTSPRLVGRASRGLAKDLSLASWLQDNTYSRPPEISADRRIAASVIAPANGNGATTGPPEVRGVDLELIPVPTQGTGAPLAAEFGPVRGRGDALWRGLSRAEGDLAVLLPDLSAASLAAIPTLVAPLLERDGLELVKGYSPAGASEASRLVGQPLIHLHHPELAGLVDPLYPFVAARLPLLESLPFPVGAGVDASLLLDAARLRGTNSVAQAALPQLPAPVRASTQDAHSVIAAFLSRSRGGSPEPASPSTLAVPDPGGAGFDYYRTQTEERPPVDSLSRTDGLHYPAPLYPDPTKS